MIGTLEQTIETLTVILFDEHTTCPVCHGAGLIDCPRHGHEVDEDGWCIACDNPMDGGPVNATSCPCQADTVDELWAMAARLWGVDLVAR